MCLFTQLHAPYQLQPDQELIEPFSSWFARWLIGSFVQSFSSFVCSSQSAFPDVKELEMAVAACKHKTTCSILLTVQFD